MKIGLTLGACALAALTAGCASTSTSSASEYAYGEKPAAQESADAHAAPPSEQDMQQMMEAWDAARALGEPHAAFAQDVGKWNLAFKSWMDPNAPPMEAKLVATRELALGGRFMIERVKGDMGPMGPFEGLGVLGYNNLTQRFDHVWLDTFATGMMISHGRANADGSVTLTGQYDNPTGGTVSTRSVIHPKGPDESLYEMFENRGQGEMKSFEITYTRAK